MAFRKAKRHPLKPPDPQTGEALDVGHSLGGESTEGFRKADLSARLERYGNARENALAFRDFLLTVDEVRLAKALGDCGNYATFREYFTVGQIRLSKFCTCKKHLICPLCAIRRGAKALLGHCDGEEWSRPGRALQASFVKPSPVSPASLSCSSIRRSSQGFVCRLDVRIHQQGERLAPACPRNLALPSCA